MHFSSHTRCAAEHHTRRYFDCYRKEPPCKPLSKVGIHTNRFYIFTGSWWKALYIWRALSYIPSQEDSSSECCCWWGIALTQKTRGCQDRGHCFQVCPAGRMKGIKCGFCLCESCLFFVVPFCLTFLWWGRVHIHPDLNRIILGNQIWNCHQMKYFWCWRD